MLSVRFCPFTLPSPGTTGGGRCRSCRGRRRPTWRLDAAGALRSGRTCPGRPAQQTTQSFSQARYPGALPAADRGLPVRGGCHWLHGCPETDQELLNIKGVMRTGFLDPSRAMSAVDIDPSSAGLRPPRRFLDGSCVIMRTSATQTEQNSSGGACAAHVDRVCSMA